MIQIRNVDGSVVPVPDGMFLELVSDHDQTVMLAFMQPTPGVILQITPGTQDAARYEKTFAKQKVQFASKMICRESGPA